MSANAKPTLRKVREGSGVSVTSNMETDSAKEVASVTIPGLGHYWPGGPQNLPAAIAGPYINVFNATDFIWEFFAKHACEK